MKEKNVNIDITNQICSYTENDSGNFYYRITDNPDAPLIGSSLSSLLGIVNMFSILTRISEPKIHYLLDAYYQARQKWENEETVEYGKISSVPLILDLKLEEHNENNPADNKEKSDVKEKREEIQKPKKNTEVDVRAFKQKINERFLEMRKKGKAKTGDLIKMSDGKLTYGTIQDMIESLPVPYEKYAVLEKLLDKIEQHSA